MSLNWLLIWISGVSCALNLAYALRSRQSPAWGWRVILSGLLLLLGLCWWVVPGKAGYVVSPLWLLFVLLPGLLLRRVNRLISRRCYRRAFWLARLAGWLHPCDGWPQQTQLIRALALFEQGQTDEASVLIATLGAINTSLGHTARLIQAQQTGQWGELLEEIDGRYSLASIVRSDTLLIARLQALGELGRLEDMLGGVEGVLSDESGLSELTSAILQMRVAALTGQVAPTQRQLTSLTHTYPEDVRRYWLLTARQVAGEAGVSDGFRELHDRAGPYLRPMIQRRLDRPLPVLNPEELSPEAAETVKRLAEKIEQDQQMSAWSDDDDGRPWATWLIALGLIANFLREIPGGSMNLINLTRLGALVIPQSLTPGEWWRVLTAGLLHFGPIHLGLNLLGLLVLAPRLERAWGRLPMVVCYLCTTFTSMALAPHVMRLTDEGQVLVGASGGVMGLLGGLVGLMLVDWLRHRNEQTRRPLLYLLMIIALQTTFDLSTPNVSFTCHSLGLATGVVFGTTWSWLAQRRNKT